MCVFVFYLQHLTQTLDSTHAAFSVERNDPFFATESKQPSAHFEKGANVLPMLVWPGSAFVSKACDGFSWLFSHVEQLTLQRLMQGTETRRSGKHSVLSSFLCAKPVIFVSTQSAGLSVGSIIAPLSRRQPGMLSKPQKLSLS